MVYTNIHCVRKMILLVDMLDQKICGPLVLN